MLVIDTEALRQAFLALDKLIRKVAYYNQDLRDYLQDAADNAHNIAAAIAEEGGIEL